MSNTPALETERLILRRFTTDDLEDLYRVYADEEANRFLPWFPAGSRDDAGRIFEEQYAAAYARPRAYAYAVCLKEDNRPVGYVHAAAEEPYDLGYGLRQAFWGRGIASEAAGAVVEQARRDGVPYLTATHDVDNPRSGGVMRNLGMRYQYSYRELWRPKELLVTFRLYQLSLDGGEYVYKGYWDRHPVHFVEAGLGSPWEGGGLERRRHADI